MISVSWLCKDSGVMTLHDSDNSFGVVFDMDGVLVDSAAPHLESWRQLAAEHGSEVTDAQFALTFGRQNRDIIPILLGEQAVPRWRELADRKEELYRSLVSERPPIVEGAVELVRSLHQSGFRLAIGSSGPLVNIELIVAAMDVADCFKVIVSGDDVQRGKPNPQVFTLACQRLDLSPDRCVVVEDAPAGIEAAIAAKTKAIAVLMHHPRESFANAHAIVSRLADLSVDSIGSLLSEN